MDYGGNNVPLIGKRNAGPEEIYKESWLDCDAKSCILRRDISGFSL